MHAMQGCTIDVQRAFGPAVSTACLGGFDFTLLFEETILTILPQSVTCKSHSPLLCARLLLARLPANAVLQSFSRLAAHFNCGIHLSR